MAGLAMTWAVPMNVRAAARAAPSFDLCEAAVRHHPERKESFRCFWEVARALKAWDDAARRLEAHLALDPSNPRAMLTLAAVEWDRGSGRAERLYREAAEGFASIGDANGEVFSRMGLAGFLRQRGRAAEAEPVLAQALAAARGSGDPTLVARVRIDQTVQAFARSDFGEALRLLREAEGIAIATGSTELRARILADSGYAYWELGQHRQSLRAYAEQADLLHGMGTAYEEARARHSIAVLAHALRVEGSIDEQEARRLAREALDAAVRSGNRDTEARVRVLLSHHLGAREALVELERALALARAAGDRNAEREALRQLGVRRLLADPGRAGEAFREVEEAADDARSSGDFEDYARARVLVVAMRHRTGPRDRWITDGLAALDAIERIRDLQPEGTVRARIFAPWAFAYSRFAGQLMSGLDTSPDPQGDLDLAFSTLERMRARTLLEELERAGSRPRLDSSDSDLRRRDEVLGEIAKVQRSLLTGGLPEGELRGELDTLDRLEEEEAGLRDAIARRVPEFARFRPAAFPGLAALRDRLEPDQALLSFDLPVVDAEDGTLFDSGGSWVVLVTREGAWTFRLPEPSVIEDRVAVFLGLCQRGDGSEGRAAARLFSDLLRPALSRAGSSIRRLVIVPDGALSRLPFAALREDEGGPPLAGRYEIESAASATLWLRCKGPSTAVAAQGDALILADPDAAGAAAVDDGPASDTRAGRARFGPLPHARREAGLLARDLGPGSRVLLGGDASEKALKESDLRPFALVHFAAHAVVDEAHPERSAVILAPGGAGEDGLLQIREIANLPMEGRVVVLSSCRSGSGVDLVGEGALSLARAFFQAGARTVVATLWPVRDEDAAAFDRSFGRAIGGGLSVAAANAAAAREAIRAGRPASAWAGAVVLGDGEAVLLPGGGGRGTVIRLWGPAAAGALLAAALVVALGLRRARAVR